MAAHSETMYTDSDTKSLLLAGCRLQGRPRDFRGTQNIGSDIYKGYWQ